MSAVEKELPAAAYGVTVEEATRNLTASTNPAIGAGQVWRTRSGGIAAISHRLDAADAFGYPWAGRAGGKIETWTEDGRAFVTAGDHDNDLIELIEVPPRTVSDLARTGTPVSENDLEGLGDPEPEYRELHAVAEKCARAEVAARLLASLIVSEYSLEGVSANFQPRLVDLAVEYTDALRVRLAVKS